MATTRDSVETNFSNILEQWKKSSVMVPASTSKYLADKDNTGDPSKEVGFGKFRYVVTGKLEKQVLGNAISVVSCQAHIA